MGLSGGERARRSARCPRRKHYRRFFPLSAGIDVSSLSNPGFNAPEFEGVAYNQPPTAEPIYVEPIGAPSVCVTGGRGRVDYRFTRGAAIYAWLGRYVGFSERQANSDCKTDDTNRTDTWDTAAGTEIDFDGSRSHVRAWAESGNPDEADTGHVFYSEGYVRYDVVKHLAGAFSIQAQGNSRAPLQAGELPNPPGSKGTTTSRSSGRPPRGDVRLRVHLTAWVNPARTPSSAISSTGAAVEGRVEEDHARSDWSTPRSSSLASGAGACVAFRACAILPPFEGARLELVSRF